MVSLCIWSQAQYFLLFSVPKGKKFLTSQQFIASAISYRNDSSSSGKCPLKPIKKSERLLSPQDTLRQSFYRHWLKSPSNIHELQFNKNYYHEKLCLFLYLIFGYIPSNIFFHLRYILQLLSAL